MKTLLLAAALLVLAASPSFAQCGKMVLNPATGKLDCVGTSARGGQGINIISQGAKCDGTTDDTTALQGTINAVITAGGGIVVIPSATCRINGQITWPNGTGAQVSVRITGAGPSHNGMDGAPLGGSILDMRSATAPAKIFTRGPGYLEIDHVTLADFGTTGSNAFVLSEQTTLHIHDVEFWGRAAGVSAVNDGILLGSPLTNTYPFRGYGTAIRDNYFGQIKRAVVAGMDGNAVLVEGNTVWTTSGCSTCAAFEIDGLSGDNTSGVVFRDNLVEATHYLHSFYVTNATTNTFSGNSLWDASGTTTSHYYFDTAAQYNIVHPGYTSLAFGAIQVGETGSVSGTNTWWSVPGVAQGHINGILDLSGRLVIGGQFNQNSTKTFAGSCGMSSGTSCTFQLVTGGYNGTPICIASAQGTTAISAACSWTQGSLTVTITAASSNSLTWGAVLIGNPN